MIDRTSHLEGIVRELVKLPREREWVVFKQNNSGSGGPPHKMLFVRNGCGWVRAGM